MAGERRIHEGDCVAILLAGVCQLLTGERIQPDKFNPFRKPKPKSEGVFREEKKQFWDRLQQGVFGKKLW
jgi:hypothetical protein